jgi:hypothetical protein
MSETDYPRYEILTSTDPGELSRAVCCRIDEGWTLHGELHVAAARSGVVYAQAVQRGRRPTPRRQVVAKSVIPHLGSGFKPFY